ncbi:MAG: zinc metallopeptidase [Peptostreptococcaceae bacterium]|nr:zinc metallopeptidase [Peptostreptococcaceae bacterium]MDY5738625.1 zinc metallopeptidase [Anaerovoracaceae bacterium]
MGLSYLLLFAAMILAIYAQGKVKANFGKYSRIANSRQLTGFEAARMVLDSNGLRDVEIEPIAGSMTDHYDPRDRVLRLSETVYAVKSISAVSVACHEAGHAIQHEVNYIPLKIRNGIVPMVNLVSKLSWPMIIIGIILLSSGSWQLGNTLFTVGIVAFFGVVIFHLITLPVEFNASSRAIDQMMEIGIVTDQEVYGAKKVLNAAALTYVAALAVAVANLIRLLAIRGRN